MQRVYDVAVHVGEFRNLDLAAKGLYLFRVSIKTTDDIAGKPYAFSSEPRTRASFTRSGDEIPALADDGELPGAKVALIKVALLGSVRDLCRVLLRLDGDDDPLPNARAPEGFGVHVDYCGG